ncbi:ABC transporter permease subunit [Frankia sp. Cppng1_Ct_nod]|uniref:ABC transporter permease subunit n=1 Tax=Frankia sp. Cppng1_Ct_nod TaxID=2897162 RepID=UPI002024C1EE|nr:ABC transporter permease subunit [Frankia sp. Cppng1_Ct_nod]
MTATAEAVPTPSSPRVTPEPGVKVTQRRVLHSEWTKLYSLRSTRYSLLVALVITIGLGILISWGRASHWDQERPIERLSFDPTLTSLSGIFLAQLAVGVLGVLIVSGEYSTGMIRATMAAVPTRLPVLWAKAAVFAMVTFALMTVASFVAFAGGQAMLSSKHISTTLSQPGVLTAVIGGGLYLTVVGVLGVALGALLRSTAGGIATLFGLLLILPIIVRFLPSNWRDHIDRYLPSSAGQSILQVVHDSSALSAWTGFALFCGYALAALAGAAVLLRRRDA